MILIENVLVSEDVADNFFACDLLKCKGVCCVDGDGGAPLEQHELDELEKHYETVKPYLRKEGIEVIEKEGKYVADDEDGWVTPLVNGRECAYIYEDNGITLCGIEKAWRDGKIDFMKPVSCHLYPIRVVKTPEYDAINYERWEICRPACENGLQLNMPVYKFVKEALVRKFGQEFYNTLEAAVEYKKEHES